MVDVNVNIKVPALEKLADYVANGIGAVAGASRKQRREMVQHDRPAFSVGARTKHRVA